MTDEMKLLEMIADILADPAARMVRAYRAAVNLVMTMSDASKEQAAEIISGELDVAYEAYNMLFDIQDEHPDWTEEQVKAEAIRRKLNE